MYINWWGDALAWIKELLLWVPLKLWQGLLDALASVIEAIPVPDWVSSAGSMFAAILSGVIWFAGWLQLGTGLSIVVTGM